MLKSTVITVFSCCLICWLAVSSSVFAQAPPAAPAAQAPAAAPSPGIDWNADVITAIGIGAPPPNPANVAQARAMAIRAAIVDAQRNLASTVHGVAISAEETVENNIMSSSVVRTKVEGMLKGARQVGQPKYMSDGSVEVTVAMRRSDLANVVLPDSGFAPAPATPPPPPSAPATGAYTGLIIDAKGLNVTPAMAPKVLDDKSQEVYGASFVTRDYAVKNGVAGYVKDLEGAKKNERAGANPLVVKGLGAAGTNKTDVTLSAEDAAKVRDAAQAQHFLSQCKVLFVID